MQGVGEVAAIPWCLPPDVSQQPPKKPGAEEGDLRATPPESCTARDSPFPWMQQLRGARTRWLHEKPVTCPKSSTLLHLPLPFQTLTCLSSPAPPQSVGALRWLCPQLLSCPRYHVAAGPVGPQRSCGRAEPETTGFRLGPSGPSCV